MPQVENRVEVVIFGDRYNLKGEENPEYMQMLASLVDERMREINARNRRLNMSQTAILAALNIADELVKLRNEYQSLVELLEETQEE